MGYMGYTTAHPQHLPEQQLQQPFAVPVVFGPVRRTQFAYRVVADGREPGGRLSEAQLNALGKDGWLLVSVLPGLAADGGHLAYVFVRMEP
ncbi:MAG TPA: hypothetical protein VIU62_05495 [Chloroflexota bacterium]|jgi:hypothetical protein